MQLFNEEERPINGLDYVRKYFGNPSGQDMKTLREEIAELKEDNARFKEAMMKLTSENERLRDEIYGKSVSCESSLRQSNFYFLHRFRRRKLITDQQLETRSVIILVVWGTFC